MKRWTRNFILALAFVVLGIGENFSPGGIIPGVSALAQAAPNFLSLCYPGTPVPGTLSTLTNGNLFPDANGCVAFDIGKDPLARDLLTMLRNGWVNKGTYIPWGSTAPLNTSGATPTFTYTATALAAIEKMTANVSSITLAGMTKGSYYTAILLQDGTGSRTLAAASIVGAPTLTPAESLANAYAVWLIQATSATAAVFIADYPNLPIKATFTEQVASNGSAITGGTAQAQPTVVMPGAAAGGVCLCSAAGAEDTSWSNDFVSAAGLIGTNTCQCQIVNPGTATTTPSATNLNVRFVSP